MGGTELRELAVRGKAHAYPLRRPEGSELRQMGIRDQHLAALAWVLAAELGFGRQALIIRHEDMAMLLGCSPRSAGTYMRRLAELGLLEPLPLFVPGGTGHAQIPGSYRTTELARRVFGVRVWRAGQTCQPSETPPTGDPELEVSPVGDGSIGVPDDSTDDNAPSVKARPAALLGSDEPGLEVPLVGARQLARRLLAEQAELAERIERRLVTAFARERKSALQALAVEVRLERERLLATPADAPPRPVLDLGDLHPDDAAWLASRSPGAGRAPRREPERDDLPDVLAGAMASWERRFGGGRGGEA